MRIGIDLLQDVADRAEGDGCGNVLGAGKRERPHLAGLTRKLRDERLGEFKLRPCDKHRSERLHRGMYGG